MKKPVVNSGAPRGLPGSGRFSLLTLLREDDRPYYEEVIAIIKTELTPRELALLVLEEVNPHCPLTTAQTASLAGISERGLRKRRNAAPR